MNKSFEVSDMWKEFLQVSKMQEALMHPIQVSEMRKAFYGGCGQMLFKLRDDVGDLPEMEALATLEAMMWQIKKFWEDENKKHNNGKRK